MIFECLLTAPEVVGKGGPVAQKRKSEGINMLKKFLQDVDDGTKSEHFCGAKCGDGARSALNIMSVDARTVAEVESDIKVYAPQFRLRTWMPPLTLTSAKTAW